MKKLFAAIRQGDAEMVCALLDKKPELIACTAKAPPRKDAGQSPLQVAIKSSSFAMANLLLDRGADVNFMEAEDCGNDWRMPVIQDVAMAAVMHTRWNAVWNGKMTVSGTQEQADETFALLVRMIGMGADLTRRDSYGNTVLDRALLDARRILPSFLVRENRYLEDRVLTAELDADLTRIFELILTSAPDVTQSTTWPHRSETLLEQYLLRFGGLRYEPKGGLTGE